MSFHPWAFIALVTSYTRRKPLDEPTCIMDKSSNLVIIGEGIFGLSTAKQLSSEGFENIVVLDRHMDPE